jgi:hypothetical protein
MRTGWQKQLRREASLHHMCEENRSALGSIETKVDAINLYKRTIDWALEEGYPCIQTLRRDFSDCEAAGVFVGKHFNGEILDDQQVYVFHECTGTIRTGLNVERSIIPMLYFANGCQMTVKGIPDTGFGVRVPLYIFGENEINCEQSEDIVCVTYKFDAK